MKFLKLLTLPFVALVLTGCLYPEAQLEKNKMPNQAQLDAIQKAVDQYNKQESGLLPIKTKGQDTPIFLKYPIDFSKLKQRGLIGEPPGTSFINGGHYEYTIITPEDNPTVKLVDLRTTEALRSLQLKVEFYQQENKYPPFHEKVAKGVYSIDYEAVGLEEAPTVDSPYSQQMLPIYINEQGKLLIDYRKDLYEYIRTKEHNYQTGDDIRYLLTDYTPFSPAYSVPYTIMDGEPIFMSELPS
ncbi:hypothetical protein MUO14_00840 [Halobacillus shinanisalinarum]|uniref:Lipoprotein n=1 Tax=Halobacillus shinanisalinarum TaxID=2932258 RepID=A0ABY4GZS2_9BACI|nr:hypothetical protein [Halobacillus shinanisalinarum]UOQ93589.1 hypothetical protein MUO14_00840 [Halobacillus shinanisalinarum]